MNANEREKLIDQVMDMVRTGYTQRTIAKKLNIALRSIVTYVKERRAETIKELRTSVDAEMADMEMDRKKRVQKLWLIVLDEKQKTNERTKAIQLLQAEETLSIKRKQLAGLLPPEPPMVAIQNNQNISLSVADTVKRVFPELIDKFSHNKVTKDDGKKA